jgi:hypothetical protein
MKSSSFAKAITLGCVVCLALPVACGDDETTPTGSAGKSTGGESAGGAESMPGPGGAGGAAPMLMIPGTSDMSQTLKCGSAMCSSIKALSATPLYVDPCCAGAAKDACGLSTEFFAVIGKQFSPTCQAVGQEGPADAACPDSPDQDLPYMGTTFHVPGFAGCCRAETGTCGVVIDTVPVKELPLPFATPKLGCVDSAPFFPGKTAAMCSPGSGGSGGAAAGGAAAGGAAAGGAAAGGAGGAG